MSSLPDPSATGRGAPASPMSTPHMFGRPDVELLADLEVLRRRLCQYGPNAKRCDCKFGASGKGEESGCPEIRQAIAIISGQREQVIVTKEMFEETAVNAMRRIRSVVDAFEAAQSNPARSER